MKPLVVSPDEVPAGLIGKSLFEFRAALANHQSIDGAFVLLAADSELKALRQQRLNHLASLVDGKRGLRWLRHRGEIVMIRARPGRSTSDLIVPDVVGVSDEIEKRTSGTHHPSAARIAGSDESVTGSRWGLMEDTSNSWAGAIEEITKRGRSALLEFVLAMAYFFAYFSNQYL